MNAEYVYKLGVDMRREVVRELTEAGMSTRAIAPVVGVSNYTVHADQQAVRSLTPEPEPEFVSATEALAQMTSSPATDSHSVESATAPEQTPVETPTGWGVTPCDARDAPRDNTHLSPSVVFS